MSKDHFYFSHSDRIVAVVLLFVIIGLNLVRHFHNNKSDYSVLNDSILTQSFKKPVVEERVVAKRQERDTVRYSKPSRKDNVSYPKENVSNRRNRNADKVVTVRDTTAKDTMRSVIYKPKQRPHSPLDINVTDSASLTRLPGIGPVYAARIVRYRDKLGGFTSTLQLMEINGLPDSLMNWFVVTDSVPPRPVRVNSMTLAELRTHPYIDFYQARAIVELRRERGIIKGPEQLSLLHEFTAQDLERLNPYLSFE